MPSRKRKQPTPEEEEEELDVDDAPTSIDPYAVLSVPKDATSDQIKSAYRMLALKHHPDKVSEDEKETAHTKFQEIAFAYAILSDERRRSAYDATGRTEESLDLADDDFSWADFFRAQYEDVVTVEKINEFAREYRGSEEERKAVLEAYTRHKGKMAGVYEDVMLSDAAEDEERFRGIIKHAMSIHEVDAFARFTSESEKSIKRRVAAAKKRKQEEAAEAEEVVEEMEFKAKAGGKKDQKGASNGNLAALIQQRQKGRADNFIADLEAKYGPPKGKKGSKRAIDEPPEEAFASNAKKSRSKM